MSYRDQRGRPKSVRYWGMEAGVGEAAPRHEVDAVRWVPLEKAAGELTYPRDRELLAAFTRLLTGGRRTPPEREETMADALARPDDALRFELPPRADLSPSRRPP